MEKNNKYLKKYEDQGCCFSTLPFESLGLAGKEVLDLLNNVVKKASESLHYDFSLLLSYFSYSGSVYSSKEVCVTFRFVLNIIE